MNSSSTHVEQGSSPRSQQRASVRPAYMGLAVFIGIVVGILGVALHGNIWMLGEVSQAWVIPWGALLAILIAFLAQVWIGLQAGSVVEPTVMGCVSFTVATAAYLWPGPDQLVVPYNSDTIEMLPGPTIASLVWWLGTGAIALVSMIVVKWVLTRDSAHQRVADAAGSLSHQ